jgi:hypothetical protein
MERETGIEPATSSLGSWRSTAELLPLTEASAQDAAAPVNPSKSSIRRGRKQSRRNPGRAPARSRYILCFAGRDSQAWHKEGPHARHIAGSMSDKAIYRQQRFSVTSTARCSAFLKPPALWLSPSLLRSLKDLLPRGLASGCQAHRPRMKY